MNIPQAYKNVLTFSVVREILPENISGTKFLTHTVDLKFKITLENIFETFLKREKIKQVVGDLL